MRYFPIRIRLTPSSPFSGGHDDPEGLQRRGAPARRWPGAPRTTMRVLGVALVDTGLTTFGMLGGAALANRGGRGPGSGRQPGAGHPVHGPAAGPRVLPPVRRPVEVLARRLRRPVQLPGHRRAAGHRARGGATGPPAVAGGRAVAYREARPTGGSPWRAKAAWRRRAQPALAGRWRSVPGRLRRRCRPPRAARARRAGRKAG